MSKLKAPTTAETAAELAKVEAEPFIMAEKLLVGGSLTLGIFLLGILYWLSQRYFPAS